MKPLAWLLSFTLLFGLGLSATANENATIKNETFIVESSTTSVDAIATEGTPSNENAIVTKSKSSSPIWIGGTIFFLVILGWMTNKLFKLKAPYQFEDRPEDFS